MVLRELKRRMNGGWKPVSVKYIILSSFKGVILKSDYLQNEDIVNLV